MSTSYPSANLFWTWREDEKAWGAYMKSNPGTCLFHFRPDRRDSEVGETEKNPKGTLTGSFVPDDHATRFIRFDYARKKAERLLVRWCWIYGREVIRREELSGPQLEDKY